MENPQLDEVISFISGVIQWATLFGTLLVVVLAAESWVRGDLRTSGGLLATSVAIGLLWWWQVVKNRRAN